MARGITKKNNLTQHDIAKSINVSRQYYGMIENGDRTPSVTIAQKLGTLLKFDWTIFFEYKSYKM
ncbi:hypothetical protein NG54_07785 [Heyndrickxia ginsengihumi]|uniref:HTH cro/C1-type domain-containing protein n=1 Tax=Heyndrickxia ginsengihumi TaxID=363870 RepID=A0A0A6Y000_9BACI|nr:helix-turn-helix transcriptional regulator [Heyndrickxia ginsengihumi]KHD85662.1 hypothetical protein NG54_07785 [Heyndrickxia ginsengihumi]